jgi:Subtilase family
MPVVTNGAEAYQGDQLLAEREYVGLVQDELRQLQVGSSVLGSHTGLGLALLSLPDVAVAAAGLRSDPAMAQAASQAWQAQGQGTARIGDLDLLLYALRSRIREAHDGWVPALGKNRLLGRVQGSPYIKGGVGEPSLASPLTIPALSGQPGARVAVLDTRLFAHPDLIGRFAGNAVTSFAQQPRATQGHSTFVAGLIAQRAPDAEIVVREVLDDDGMNASSWDVAVAMADLRDTGVSVLNLSLGCVTADRLPPLCLRRAAERLIPSVVIVAAAGNNGAPDALATASGLTANTPVYPAALDGVLGVGAYDPAVTDLASGSAEPAAFSPSAPWVALLAPGVRVTSTFLPGQVQLVRRDPDGTLSSDGTADFGMPGYASWDGTSFAAASVTGAIAALIQAGRMSGYEAASQLGDPVAAGGAGADIVRFGGS